MDVVNPCLSETRLMLNSDGSIYHLHLLPGDLAEKIILVGDPNRVPMISKHFDSIRVQKSNREYVTHTGRIGQQEISVVSTGVGIGNIDIVLNELDAVHNIDFTTRQIRSELKRLSIVRLGTAGALQEDIDVDSFVVSSRAFAADGLLSFYRHQYSDVQQLLLRDIQQHFNLPLNLYVADGNSELVEQFSSIATRGMTFTCMGFYGPQHRQLRLDMNQDNGLICAGSFRFHDERVVNFEMETAAIYALGQLLGHRCCSVSAILANRPLHIMSSNPRKAVEKLIEQALPLYL